MPRRRSSRLGGGPGALLLAAIAAGLAAIGGVADAGGLSAQVAPGSPSTPGVTPRVSPAQEVPATADVQEGTGDVVRAVLFYSPTCPHCRDVIEDHLPPLLDRYGSRLQIVGVNTATEGGQALYGAMVLHFDLPRERIGVPTMVVGRTVLVGAYEIPTRLPELADAALGRGGIDWPEVPRMREVLAAQGLLDESPAAVVDADPVAAAEEAGAAPRDPSSRPSPDPAPAVAEPRPQAAAEPVTAPVTEPASEAATQTQAASEPAPEPAPEARPLAAGAEGDALVRLETGAVSSETVASRFLRDPAGNGAAAVVLVLMMAALGRVVARVRGTGRRMRVPGWVIPAAALAGIGVASYLAFVEVTGADAVCGPVGDCNAVQQSPYARLFGLVPVGVLGLAGYVAMLAAWGVAAWSAAARADRLERASWLALRGMAVVGVILSIYLTFLEPFVIGATCAWCLTSALLVTAILLTATEAFAWREAAGDLGDEDGAGGAAGIGISPTADRPIPAGVGARDSHS